MRQQKPKPKLKTEIGISHKLTITRQIFFSCSNDAFHDITPYGLVEPYIGNSADWELTVNPMYDFDEVLKYMENY